MKPLRLRLLIGILTVAILILVYNLIPKARTSPKYLSEFAKKNRMTYSEAFAILKQSGIADEGPRPTVAGSGIVIDGNYFFPVSIPMAGFVSERGYFVDPVSGSQWYIDNPDKTYIIWR